MVESSIETDQINEIKILGDGGGGVPMRVVT